MRNLRSALLASLAFGVLVTVAAVPVVGQTGFQPGKRVEGFTPIDQYQLVLDGEVDKAAQIYSNPSPAILVVSDSLQAPVVLWPQTRAVESINFMKLAKNSGGGLDIYPDPVVAVHAPFSVDQLEVRFAVDEHTAVLRPRPALLGLFDAATLRENKAEYAERADYYEPSASGLDALRADGREVRVRVFFGTWCPACGQMVPRIMKVAERLEGSRLNFEFYGLPRGFSGEPEAAAYGVTSVPTGVVFIDGREAGRIGGTEWRSPEDAIGAILGRS